MNSAATQTFELVLGRPPEHKIHEFRGTLEQVKGYVARQWPGATCVLRGYTTFRIYLKGSAIGSMQPIA